jgi:predicted acylesterase/phospholipase RssA
MGIYEVGAIRTIVNNLTAGDSHYDVVSGVSIGSINAALFGRYGQGEQA